MQGADEVDDTEQVSADLPGDHDKEHVAGHPDTGGSVGGVGGAFHAGDAFCQLGDPTVDPVQTFGDGLLDVPYSVVEAFLLVGQPGEQFTLGDGLVCRIGRKPP